MNKIVPVYKSQSYFLGNIFVTEHTPTCEVRGIFVLLHGFPAWVTKNYDVGEVLAQNGFKVYIPHHQGLGQSKGTFQFTENIQATREFLIQIKRNHPNLTLSLLGHSWGGYLSLRNLDLISDRLILLAPLARFPDDHRRQAMTSNLYNKNISDLTDYSLESLETEFRQLEEQLDQTILMDESRAPKTLLLYGTNDEVIPADLICDFAKEVASSRFTTIVSDADHRLSKRRPVLETIQAWL